MGVIKVQQDFSKIPLLGLVMESSSTAPTSPVAGQLWLDTSLSPARGKVYENGAWVLISNTNVLDTSTTFGGDVSGIYSNLQLGAGVVGTTELATSGVTYAKIQNVTASRLLGNPSGTAAAPSEISLDATLAFTGTSLERAAISGDITIAAGSNSSAITSGVIVTGDFNTATTLDAIATARPATAAITANSQKIISLGTPTADTDAATKAYVDAARSGLNQKDSVRVATTANITLSGAQTIDGISAVAGDRVLVKNQTTGADNGIYVVATGAWSRSTDADTSAEVTSGMSMWVNEGTQNGDTGWVLTTDNPITLGTTSLAFTQNSGLGQVTAGNGLSKTGNTLDVNVDASTIEIATDTLQVKDLGITNAKIANGTIDLTTKVTGTLPQGNGGTGQSSYTAGNILYANASNNLTKLGIGGWGDVLTVSQANTPTWSDALYIFADYATTANVASFSTPPATVDGFSPASGDLILVKDQTTASENGVYYVNGSVWTRWSNTGAAVGIVGRTVVVKAGTANGGTYWHTDFKGTQTVGTDAMNWYQPLTTNSGTAKYAADLGALTAGTWSTVTHNLNTTDVVVSFKDTSTTEGVVLDWKTTGVNTIQVKADVAVSSGAVRVVVIG